MILSLNQIERIIFVNNKNFFEFACKSTVRTVGDHSDASYPGAIPLMDWAQALTDDIFPLHIVLITSV